MSADTKIRVLVAIDSSEASHKVVEFLQRHRAMFGAAHLTCVYIDPPPPLRAVGAFGADPGMPAVTPGDPDVLIAPIVEPLRAAGYPIDLLVREGEPGPEIAQIAGDGDFDLVIIGAGKRGLIRRKRLGSVTTKVLNACAKAVLMVR